MKNFLNAHCTSHRLLGLVLAASLALPLTSLAASVALATAPLATSTTSAVSPNLMLLMDDSGSMDWDHMPDDASDAGSAVSFSYGYYGLRSSQCNQVYYNPSLTYLPPVNADGTSYADATFTAALPDGYKASGGSNVAVNLNSSFKASLSLNPDSTGQSAYYYSYSGAQTTARQKNYNSTTNTFYNECHSASGATPGSTVFSKFRLATTETTTITVNSSTANATFIITVGGGNTATSVSSITVGGTTITSNSTTGGSSISAETSAIAGKITSNGYSATSTTGGIITVTGPASVGAIITVNKSGGNFTIIQSTITPISVVSGITVNGGQLMLSGSAAIDSNTSTTATNIAAKINAAGYSATASGNVVTITGPTSAANYTPALTYSGTMTYTTDVFPDTTAAKLTNFADWYSYYRTRMLMMKTSTGRAFKPIDNKFRVGFATLDNNNYDGTHSATADAVDIATFDATQKSAWYVKLYASTPGNSTSLRSFLSTAGQFYAHKLPSNQLNHLPVKDPIQYSCQQNFAIMSTDGFWNGNAGYQMDGSTAVGNQDGGAPRPQYDGGIANKTTKQVWQTQTQTTKNTSQILQVQAQTSQLQSSTSNLQSTAYALQSSTSNLQSQVYPLLSSTADYQKSVANLQAATAPLNQSTKGLLAQTAPLNQSAYALQAATAQLQQAVSGDGGSTWSGWSNTASCTWATTAAGLATITVSSTAASSFTITVAGTSATKVTGISVGGTTITSGSYNGSTTTSTEATNVAALVTVSGWSASAVGNVITVTGPAAVGAAVVVTKSGSGTDTFTPSAITASVVSSITVGGTTITSGSAAVSSSTSTTAANIAAKISAAGYSATVSGSVVTIKGPASAVGAAVVVNSSGAGTFTVANTGQTKCQYATLSGYSNVTSCTVSNKTATTNGTNWPGNKVLCQYSATAVVTSNVSSCGAIAQTASTTTDGTVYAANGSGNAVTCSNGTLGSATPVSSCTYNVSSGTSGTWNPEVVCSASATATVTNNVATCTPATASGSTTNGSAWVAATTCGYGTLGSAAPVGSCTYNVSSGSGTWTPKTVCSYGTSPTVTTVTSCTPVAASGNTTNGSSWTPATICGYSAYSAPTSAASCTYQNQSTSAPYAQAVTCSYAATSPTATTVLTCTPNQTTSTVNGTVWNPAGYTCGYAAYTAPSPGACTYQNKSASSPYSGPAVTCSYATTSPTVTNVSSCTPVAQTTGTTNGAWNATAHTCAYSTYTTPANASSCTTVAQDTTSPYDMTASGGVATTCSWSATTGWTNVTSCVLVPKDTTSPYNMTASSGVATLACQTVGTNACASGTTCATATTGPTPVSLSSCTGGMSSCTSPFTGTSCVTTSCTTTAVFPRALVASCACTAAPSCTTTDTASPFKTTQCDIVSSTANNVICAPQAASAGNNYTTVTCTGASGGTSDNLADVAMYYYQTDLRDQALWNNCTGGGTGSDGTGAAGDVCANNVYISGDDNNTKQHMTTFTLGLGASGRMVFSPSYKSDASGDYVSVKNGAIADSTTTPPTCSWLANGSTCNWPIPGMDGSGNGYIENIDDLWHAAVDGRGAYFSATDPASLATGLSSALSSITARKGAAAAAATSTLNPVAGNNFAYVASYTTVKWTGNLEARSISTDTGVINEAATWCVENLTAGSCSAPSSLVVDSSGSSTTYSCVTPSSTAATCTSPAVFNSLTNECSLQLPVACNGTMPALVGAITDTRKIYTANSTGTSLINFDAAYAAANPTNFSAAHINTLSQWASLSATQKTAAAGANLVNFLRGQNGFEDRASNLVGVVDNRLYRYREAVMGDALESQPAYLGPPTFSYADPGYSDFKTAKSGRPGTVYIGANDGMMHAFAADTGIERWAYVPSVVIPNMWILADKNYDIKHANFVNGSPIMSDVCTAHCTDSATAVWRTILVGGLNGGGRGYYALDITDPTAPALLWEFTPTQEANVGYSFGNPVITQKVDGTWVVLVTSGYNNTSPGDGKGYLYVLNALTGAEIGTPIPTGVGDTTTPSGLAKISAWSNEAASNVAGYVYGGDLLGNVWRFDINTAGAPLLFATLKDPSGIPQPITTSPVLGQINGKRVIFVGTGKYLETLDLSNSQVESMYAIMDDDATATFANPRTHTTEPIMVNQTLTATGSTRTVSSNKVDFTIDSLTGKRIDQGWYVDFPDSGERVNIDSKLVLGTLLVPTIVPTTTVCSPGGYGWLNYFDYSTGGPVPPSGSTGVSTPPSAEASVKYDSTIVGINLIFIEGTPKVEVVTSTDPTPRIEPKARIPPATANFTGKRMLWRELIP